jgi:hypothetical protein
MSTDGEDGEVALFGFEADLLVKVASSNGRHLKSFL